MFPRVEASGVTHMGPVEPRNQKQIYFCFICNGSGTSKFKFTEQDYAVAANVVDAYRKFSDKDRRVCSTCLRWLILTRGPVVLRSAPIIPISEIRITPVKNRKPKVKTRRKKDISEIPPLPTPRAGSYRYVTWHSQSGICHYCKQLTEGNRWTLDHKHPRSKGGKHKYNGRLNLVGCCMTCNHLKGSLTYDEFINGIKKPTALEEQPAEPLTN